MINKICKHCNIPFITNRHRTKYCSHKCSSDARKLVRGKDHPLYDHDKPCIICEECGNKFTAIKSQNRKYCSNRCYRKSQYNPEYLDSAGYVRVHCPYHPYANSTGFVHRNRLVAEKTLKRFLTPEEVIHHINEIKNDDHPENLYLFESNSAHSSYHNNVRWGNCKKIVKSNLL